MSRNKEETADNIITSESCLNSEKKQGWTRLCHNPEQNRAAELSQSKSKSLEFRVLTLDFRLGLLTWTLDLDLDCDNIFSENMF